jgi:hypothetical protein
MAIDHQAAVVWDLAAKIQAAEVAAGQIKQPSKELQVGGTTVKVTTIRVSTITSSNKVHNG